MARQSGALRRLKSPALLALFALPALVAAVPSEAFEVAESIAVVVADVPQHAELFVGSDDDATRPAALEDEALVGKATTTNKGNMNGAYAFLLTLVPLLVVIYVRLTDSGIVVVAKPQPDVQAQATNFVNEVVLVASIEHDICYDLDADSPQKVKVSAGGLGKVAGQLQRIHPTDLISVHPVGGLTEKNGEWTGQEYGFEPGCTNEEKKQGWHRDETIRLMVDGKQEVVGVFRKTVKPKAGEDTVSPQVTYVVLDHAWFRQRRSIYLDQPGSIATLRFFSLWNQAVGVLIAREEPLVYQCPDYHTALAPWYALRACGLQRPPPRVTVILHNAEYQGAISSQQLKSWQVDRLAKLLDLPVKLVRSHMMIEGGFNMLQAAMEYVLLTQGGYGVCAVSNTYAEESKVKHRALWPLPEVVGLDNPMLENERPKNTYAPEPAPELAQRRRNAKQKLYAHKDFRQIEAGQGAKGFGYLENNENSRIFVFLGRWVKQKGMDYIADIAEWMVKKHRNAQLAIMGPPGDSFGTYCQLKLQMLASDPAYAGRLKVLPEFYNINQVDPDVKFAFDFCFMPSRDEPFGYVDIEFGWFGALTVGSITGGLGKVPGVYYIPSNVNSSSHICHLLKGCVDRAMALTDRQLTAIAETATQYKFPVEVWQADLLKLYKKAQDKGNEYSRNAAYLRNYPAVNAIFSDEKTVQRNPKAPRRTVTRRGYGTGSLEAMPVSFSIQQMSEQERRLGAAADSLRGSFRPGGDAEDPSEINEFIRREVDDDAIRPAVANLMQGTGANAGGDSCFLCREKPAAQDILALTQWEAMTEGEYGEGFHLSLRQPFWGCCKCITKFLTKWLSGSWFGLKRIDLFIILHYLTAPLLQAFCIAQLPEPEKNKWPLVAGAFVLPFAIVFWTKLSMHLEPNRVMALAVILRIPLLFLTTISDNTSLSFDTALARLALFVLLGFLAGADQIFVYYNFMGAAIGDTSKLALRMGMCTGILGATSYIGQVAISHAVTAMPSLKFGGIRPFSFIGLLADVLFATFYICAPACYREFCLPEWDLSAMLEHRKTLKYITANIILGAVTDPSISGAATMIWRAQLKPFADHGFLGAPAMNVYEWLMPLLLAVAVILWSYFLYRMPNSAACIVKAFAFLLVPPAFLRSIVAIFIENNDDNVTTIDYLFIFSLVLDVIRSTSIYIALLSVVGSRWRFVSFTTAVMFVRQLFAFLVRFLITVMDISGNMESWDFAKRWMPVLAFVSLVQWVCSWGGFLVFDRESSALLTNAKKKIASDNARIQSYINGL